MELPDQPVIVIAGAGSIGCYVGGCLALAGRQVRFLVRPRIADRLRGHGLQLSDFEGLDRKLDASLLTVSTDPSVALAGADVIIVTVKSGATAEMAASIARHAPQGAVVASFQNGIRNVETLRAAMPGRRVLAAMVPFNVVQSSDPDGTLHVHRASAGTILIAQALPPLAPLLDVPHAHVAEHTDIVGVQWGKLLFNLNNALNALSGLPLAQQLGDRRWRLLLADQMQEARAVLRRAGIHPIGTEGVPPALIPYILRLPDWIFTRIAGRMLAIDASARSSMWEDLEHRRHTEIDHFQGEILRLAVEQGKHVPLTRALLEAVKSVEATAKGSPCLPPEAIRKGLRAA